MEVINIDILQEYKDLYNNELSIAENLNSKISNSITLLTIIGTANVLLLNCFFPIKIITTDKFSCSIFYCFVCVINIVTFINTLYRFVKAYTGRVYNYFYLTEIINKCAQYRNNIVIQLQSQNIPINNDEIDRLINSKMNKWIINEYECCAKINRSVNSQKSQELYKLTQAVVMNMIIVFVSFFLYIVKINIDGGLLYVE